MSRLIEDQGKYLQLLQSTSKLHRKALLTSITNPQLKAMCEITHNVLKGIVVLPPYAEKHIEEIQENNPFGGKYIYETRETKSSAQRINGRCFFY